MRDIPIFTTQYGVASLFLKKIPYTKEAYIEIRDCTDADLFVEECRSFCRMAGAERVFASGHPCLDKLPLYTAIHLLSTEKAYLPETDALIKPVDRDTVEIWRRIYNEKMRSVPGAAYMTLDQADQMLKQQKIYFVYRGSELLGIGAVDGCTVQAIAAVKPGSGKDVLIALACTLPGDVVQLCAASTNRKAMDLYHDLGFSIVGETARWHQIL